MLLSSAVDHSRNTTFRKAEPPWTHELDIEITYRAVQVLGLTRPAVVKRQFLHHVFQQLEEHTSNELQPRKRRDDVLGEPDWARVNPSLRTSLHSQRKIQTCSPRMLS